MAPTEVRPAEHLDRLDIGSCCGSGPLLAGLASLSSYSVTTEPARAAAPTGTFVLRGATVLPVDQSFSEVDAIAVRDGRIIAVGTEAEVVAAAGTDAMVVDRSGAVVLPGFIEPHAHVLPTGMFSSWIDLGALRFSTVDEVIEHLIAVAADHDPADGWILGRQFDPALQVGAVALTADMLDRVSTDVPVALVNASLHFGYVNNAALRAAGLTAETPDIAGSPYGSRADGSLDGVLKGQASMLSVLAHNPGMATTDLNAAGLAVLTRAASQGVTTICDQGNGGILGPADVEIYAAMAATGTMATRIRYSVMDTRSDGFAEAGIEPRTGDELVRAVGWKVISDGSNQGRTGHQREPYLGGTDRGLPYLDPAELAATVRRQAEAGWQVVVHANGDQAIDHVLDAFETLEPALRDKRRHRIEHCSILHDDQIARIAALGLSPSFLIGHVHYWGQAFRDDIIGPERADLLDRTASCTAAGITWTIHSDEMVTPIEPLRCIENAVTRTLWREPETVLAPDERVSVEQAIRSMTAHAAWQCRSEDEIGSLEVGKLADFVVLDADPRSVDPSAIRHIGVLETWLGGRQVWP